MIKYLGSKLRLLDDILSLSKFQPGQTVLDVFSGTSRVSYAFKQKGCRVLANDTSHYAQTIARCYLEAHEETHAADATEIIKELNSVQAEPGYVTETFCYQSRFFHPRNGAKIDAIRERIEKDCYPEPLKSVLLTSLMEAADAVDSTCGVQMAYLKKYADRAMKDIALKLPPLLKRVDGCKALGHDAREVGQLVGHVDIAYLDPYNQHSYLGNYHIWESLVLWDKPEVYGVACKRVDTKEKRSDFNSKLRCLRSFQDTIGSICAFTYIVSFNNEGFLTREDVEDSMSAALGGRPIQVHEFDYKRYVGAQIGIHGKNGEVVGQVSHTRNKELMFIVHV
jgi:adenine-specific DNA-methyltransferase